MELFIEYLKKEKLLESLTKNYKENLYDKKKKDFLNKIIKELHKLDDFKNETHKNYDLFASLYENNLNHIKRKKLGEFYTPIPIIDYILNAISYNSKNNNIETKRLIDISCGTGSFIIRAIDVLINCLMEQFNVQNLSELSPKEAKNIIMKIQECIYGVDINPVACVLCQINIQYLLFNVLLLIREKESDYKMPIFNIYNSNALNLDNSEKYDFIVGNPPYIFIRDMSEDLKELIKNNNFKTGVGQYDYYQIFIELGIKLLKNNGYLGYIVPDSILALSNRAVVRKYIYDKTKIREIYHTGPKFLDPVVSNIIIILEKEQNKEKRENNIVSFKIPVSKYQKDRKDRKVSQKTIEGWDYKFLINLNEADIFIIDNLNNKFPKLNDLIKNKEFNIVLNRGVELSKDGKVIFCANCKKYLPIPTKELKCNVCGSSIDKNSIETIIYDIIPEKSKNNNFKSYVYSINRYKIKIYKYINMNFKGINYKSLDNYVDRIIIRQLNQNNLICATHDEKMSLTSQSFYNLKINQSPILEFNNFYLLGLINSQLLSFYFIKSFGSYKKLFPRILIEKIKSLPIKVPETNEEKDFALKIVKYVKLMLDASSNSNILIKHQNTIDSLVFDLYQISNENRNFICNFMKNL